MFFGWRVVAGSFVSLMLVVGFFTYTFTLFVVPLREEFGVGLEQVMYAPTLGPLLALFVSPVLGIMVDRYPVRLLMAAGCILFAAGFFAMSRATSINAFIVFYALSFSLCNGLAGTIAASAAVSRWFVRNRGRALGITTIGTSVGGMGLPPLATWWIAESGWRGAMENFALLTLLFALPWVWFNVRGRPSDMGLEPDGDGGQPEAETVPPAVPAAAAPAPPGGIRAIVGRREFWLIGISVGLLAGTFSSILANLSPYATELGATGVQASTLILLLAITGLVGKILFGLAADRFSLKLSLGSAHGFTGIAFLILALEPGYPLMVAAAMCMGFATGGFLPVWNAMVARVFGIDNFGSAMGVMGPIVTLLIMPAFILVGRLHDLQGDYVTALLLFAGLIVVAAGLLFPVRIPEEDGR